MGAIDWYLGEVDPQIPEVIRPRWDDAVRGVRALQVEWEAEGGDWAAIDWDAAEFAPNEAAIADLEDWCNRHRIDPRAPRPTEARPPAPPAPEPPQACAENSISLYLHGDSEPDWISARGGNPDITNEPLPFVVCDSQREKPYTVDGPDAFEFFVAVDVDRDGVDDLLLIGSSGNSGAGFEVRSTAVGLPPLRWPGEEPLGISIGFWGPELVQADGGRWFGCGDLDGDGTLGFGFGTHAWTSWQGEELTIRDGKVVATAPVDGTGWRDPSAIDIWGPQGCSSASEVRTAGAAPCSSLEEWPGGEPYHGFSELTEVAPVEPGDILVSLLPQVEVWQDGEVVGDVLYIDRHVAPAYHDLAGGIVTDSRGLYSILHFPVGGDPVNLLVPDEPGEEFTLMGVEVIEGVPTALVIRRVGEEFDTSGELVLQPLDGSSAWSIPALETSEVGTISVDWDGSDFIQIGGGHGAGWVDTLDRDGRPTDAAWNVWRNWDGVNPASIAVTPAGGDIWISTLQGLFSVIQRRDRSTGEFLESHLVPGSVYAIDAVGDRLLLQSTNECIRLFNPETGEIDEIRQGGNATVG